MTAAALTAEARLAATIRRAAPWLLGTAVLLLYLGTRFSIGVSEQARQCLVPPHAFWLLDWSEKRIHLGVPALFYAGTRMAPFFDPDTIVIKRIVATGGDRVTVTPTATWVNGRVVGEGLDLATLLGRSPDSFTRALIVPKDALWVMGDTRDSYDSRYWGPLPRDAIEGRAYGLW